MGGSTYTHDDYINRASTRSSLGITGDKIFAYNMSVNAAAASGDYDNVKVHDTLNPKGKNREARDSAAHPKTLPIGVILDTTGSMSVVPKIIQAALPKLMGGFLDAKASGKQYIEDYYPAILIGANDDYYAQSHYNGAGSLQVGQFESGMEIDDNLTNLWLTGNGGGSYEESYDLALYFFARHTQHDNWDKRKRKGYLFIIGDEHLYPKVNKAAVKEIIGDDIQADIPVEAILKEAKERYHVFFIIPKLSHHYSDASLEKYWVNLLGQQHVLKLEDPHKICEMIVGAVAISEEHIGIEDLNEDGLSAVAGALVPLTNRGISVSASGLPEIPGAAGATRL